MAPHDPLRSAGGLPQIPESPDLEFRIGILHDFIPSLVGTKRLEAFTSLVRELREKVHPRGKRDLRWIEVFPDLRFKVDLGDRLGLDFYYGYVQEREDATILLATLDPGATFVDVGANFGYYTVLAARRVGAKGRVHAFEPNPAALELLRENAGPGAPGPVVLHEACLGSREGTTEFHVTEETSFSGIVSTNRSRVVEKITRPLKTLDAALADGGKGPVAAMKIDVEGFEHAVLSGARDVIRRSPDLVMQIEISGKNLDEQRTADLGAVLSDLEREGFGFYGLLQGPERIQAFATAGDAIAGSTGNVLLVRRGSSKEAALKKAARQRPEDPSTTGAMLLHRLSGSKALQQLLESLIADGARGPGVLEKLRRYFR